VRGVPFKSLNYNLIQAVMMEHYNQQYSEIDNIRMDDCMFLMSLKEAADDYQQQLMEEAKRKAQSRIKR
jgi:hypothetical protein